MHNKASYSYIREDAAQSKKSYEDKFGSKSSKASKAAAKAAKDIEDAQIAEEDAKLADAKEGVASLSLNGRTGGAKAAKEPQWSKEEDYY
eukprot:CAMPEP_0196761564 /NCGR_PEP_ID=MMETSP1095-20130614/846_1 /TAXON_ID=96789 ORGANISM="Chromulina nebulosa, Strain UTEXLB2642" /NCGR_SAMPLE_ID=MMETSP1095 /ASSEMBLY_ACC=CAM_ASM_000446 /LENGTH=89 /DNA_ID=CAMNT_0042111283 /DNA_START=577 /DNA_END=846 /DNA_ORIENTATION=-